MVDSRISLIHPTGNPNSRETALALGEANLLQKIITTVAYNPKSSSTNYLNFLPKQIKYIITRELERRTWISPNGASIQTYPWKEVIRVALVKSRLNKILGFGPHGPIDWIYTSLDSYTAKHHLQDIDAIYAYEDGAATTFEKAKKQNKICFYDLPIPFYQKVRELQIEEAEIFPDLSSALRSTHEPVWKLQRKEQEVKLADHIFVASSVTRDSLINFGVKPNKITVVPYGAPIDYFHPKPKNDELFRALFVGRLTPHKGVHYLLQAWKELRLPDGELLLVGANNFPDAWLTRYENIFRYVPSVPHASLIQYYSIANVLVLPSLLEGFGMVLLEAMACGIPVITTSNVGGADIITDGVEGFIIPIRDVEALKEKLEWCYQHPQELAEMGRAARRKAEQLTWGLYRQKLANKVQEILSNQN